MCMSVMFSTVVFFYYKKICGIMSVQELNDSVEQPQFSMCTSLSKPQTQNVRFIFPVDMLTKS